MCVTRGRQRVRFLAEDPVAGMTTTSFSTAIPSSKSLPFQPSPSPPLPYRHPVRLPFSLHSPSGTAFVFYSSQQNITFCSLLPRVCVSR